MSADRPINADVPPPPQPEPQPPAEPKATPEKAKPAGVPKAGRRDPGAAAPPPPPAAAPTSKGRARKPARRRRPIPGALKLIAALVALAVLFIVVAVLAGGGAPAGEDAPAGAGTETVTVEATDGGEGSTPAPAPEAALGFPVVATDNTTRVGGADAATTAAAVALAVFPATTEAQRPVAVTLVDEGEPLAAIAASVLVAEPVRSPILFSSGELPDPTAEAFAALDPQGGRAAGGASVFAIGDVATPDGAKVKHLAGGDPAAAAVAIAELRDRLFGSTPKHLLLAAEDPALAMPAAGWAARSGDPVLFTAADSLPQPSADYIAAHSRLPVYVLGPPSAISAKVVGEVEKIGGKVKRVAGEDPVANAIALARFDDEDFGWNINDPGHGFVLARADEPLAAAAAAPLSAAGTWGPLLLSDDADTLPTELRDYFLDVKPGYTNDPTRAFYNHVWVIGDQEAIDVKQQAEVNELAELAKIEGGTP